MSLDEIRKQKLEKKYQDFVSRGRKNKAIVIIVISLIIVLDGLVHVFNDNMMYALFIVLGLLAIGFSVNLLIPRDILGKIRSLQYWGVVVAVFGVLAFINYLITSAGGRYFAVIPFVILVLTWIIPSLGLEGISDAVKFKKLYQAGSSQQ